MEVVNLAGDYNAGTNWIASTTTGGTPGRQATATAPGDFDGNGVVDGSDFLAWQRGLGGAFDAEDLATWRTNFGNGAQAAAAQSPLLAAVTAPNAAESSSENVANLNAVGSGVIDAASLTRGPRWFVLANGELATLKSRREASKQAAANDAALTDWAPRHWRSFAADDVSAALTPKGRASGERFANIDRQASAQRSLSLSDDDADSELLPSVLG
jgi:hypothetical protein